MRPAKTIIHILLLIFVLYGLEAAGQRYENRTPANDSESENGETVSDSKQNDSAAQLGSFGSRLVFGGNFSLSFGNYTYIDISPMVSYRATPRLMVGVGGTYIYYNSLLTIIDPTTGAKVGEERVKGSIYGARTFANFAIIQSIFLQGEYEALNVEYISSYTRELQRTWIGNIFVGGGYRSYVSPNSFFQMTILYNLNYKNNKYFSPYASPFVFRAGFFF